MKRLTPAVLLFVLILAGCARTAPMARGPEPVAALPAIPFVSGPASIRVVYPPEGSTIAAVDSNFIFGSAGSGDARLTINGFRIPVAPNGAFLAFLPVPEDGRYELEARTRGSNVQHVLSVKRPAPAQASTSPPKITGLNATPTISTGIRRGIVTGGRDTLATGSDVVYGSPTPTADRRWFFPRGSMVQVAGSSGGQYRLRLAEGIDAWVDTSGITVGETLLEPVRAAGAPEVTAASRHTDLELPVAFAPFHLSPSRDEVLVTLYGRSAPAADLTSIRGGIIASASVAASAPDTVQLRFSLAGPLWGYKAFYDSSGALVLRLRHGPARNADPLAGLRVVVDPGHPPLGATGPTGLTEAEANLAISLKLADQLRQRGAEVIMTRTTGDVLKSATSSAQELWARVDFAVENDADLLVSVHNNAFPDGVNPFENYGSEAYYYHPFARDLAASLVTHIVSTTGLPDKGAKQRSLALARPTWMPSVLTESLFMMFPQQEAALRNADFQERLAAAHLRGIEQYVREYLGR